MSQSALWAILASIVITGTIFVYRVQDPTPMKILHDVPEGDYEYTCDHDIGWVMSFSSDISVMRLTPIGTTTIPSTTLASVATSSGALYRGGSITLEARGESVHITSGSTTFACAPVQMPDEAPFNFGD